MRRSLSMICCLICPFLLFGQQNMHFTNPEILDILTGNYSFLDYQPTIEISDPQTIVAGLESDVSPDSLRGILFALDAFHTRNTGSDTTEGGGGIGDARSWILSQFASVSRRNENRLVSGFFQFDQDICGMGTHKNVVAVLPGKDVADPSMILIEGHFDSRCNTSCDVNCTAKGMEDNASGTALVMELARVLSKYVFDHTLVFMATTGEEQGLYGANAFAEYVTQEGLEIKAVLNNDIVGGIICGETASPPGCPGENLIDSTQVRLFSFGGYNSSSKALCRYVKLQYREMLEPLTNVPMQLTIMSDEDRFGRGGDHIPFRQRGFPAMRFTSAHEHGDASNGPDYHDRQHTSDDILGLDTDGEPGIDSFFVDFNYLARNCAINGNAVAMAALSPDPPAILASFSDGEQFDIQIDDPQNTGNYVIGVRTHFHDFDSLYYLNGKTDGLFQLKKKELNIFLSVASVDSNGIESLFSEELLVRLSSTRNEATEQDQVRLFQNRPNPFDESTMISFWVENPASYGKAVIEIRTTGGTLLKRLHTPIIAGLNEVIYYHGYRATGTFLYTLFLDGRLIDTKPLVFAN